MALVLREAFGALRLHRVEANIQPGNLASIALVRRAGFSLEGRSRRYLKIGGRWCDHERWAILSEDVRARAGRLRSVTFRIAEISSALPMFERPLMPCSLASAYSCWLLRSSSARPFSPCRVPSSGARLPEARRTLSGTCASDRFARDASCAFLMFVRAASS